MHEISELVQFAVPVASAGGLTAIARLAGARRTRRLSRAIRPEPFEVDRVKLETDDAEDLEAIAAESATKAPGRESPALEEGAR